MWLRAAAEDRYLVSLGQPQRYGSQFHCIAPQGWQLHPVDPAVTDAEREATDMPPLATQQARVAQIQDVTGGACALDAQTMGQIQAIMEQ